eukprot:4716702-Prymnesium_polylepis.1
MSTYVDPRQPTSTHGGTPHRPISHPGSYPPPHPRRVRDRHNVDTSKVGSIFKLKSLTSP